MTNGNDYYEILGVARDATDEEIRRAFRKLAMEWHPDRNKAKGAEDQFKLVNEAYQVLIEPEKRRIYDRYGRAGVGTAEGHGGHGFEGVGFPGGFGDIFDAFFGGSEVHRESGARNGADLHYTMELSFEDAVLGMEQKVEVQRLEACSTCNGDRSAPGTKPVPCTNCRGTGQVRRSQTGLFGQFVQVVTCSLCRGEGKVVETPCTQCDGMGRTRQRRGLTVRIPAGVDTGMQVRLSGEGEAGWLGGPSGDLYVNIKAHSHSLYTRRGQNLIVELPVNIAQAALGDTVEIPLLGGGTEQIKVPTGVQGGSVLRVKGKGVPSVRNGRSGDLLVVLQVVTPRNLDPQSKKLFQELAKVLETEELGGRKGEKTWVEKIRDLLGSESL
jgi:molecular chaperone DnaJ